MKVIPFLALVALLTGCGVDGAPMRPTGGTTVSVGTGGVKANTNIGVTNGVVTLGVGL